MHYWFPISQHTENQSLLINFPKHSFLEQVFNTDYSIQFKHFRAGYGHGFLRMTNHFTKKLYNNYPTSSPKNLNKVHNFVVFRPPIQIWCIDTPKCMWASGTGSDKHYKKTISIKYKSVLAKHKVLLLSSFFLLN